MSIPKSAATSCLTETLNCEPRSVIFVVGWYACLYKTSIATRATTEAVIRVTG